MFVNNLTGLSEREREVFDQVCIHLNKCLRKMNIRFLDGEEDQILIDLWMDSFPYKLDENGNYVMRTVREKSWETVDGKYVEIIKEKQVRELDFTKSLMEKKKPDGTYLYKVGIYKWRGEQLLINKCKYLFGDRRTREMTKDKDGKDTKKAATEIQIDAWGNERVRAVYKKEIDPLKSSKRDLSLCMVESDLHREGEEPMTLDDVCGGTPVDSEDKMLKLSLKLALSDKEMAMAQRIMDGESMSAVVRSLTLTSSQLREFKEKVGRILKGDEEASFAI